VQVGVLWRTEPVARARSGRRKPRPGEVRLERFSHAGTPPVTGAESEVVANPRRQLGCAGRH
jgi:hypothetical protein